MTKTDAFWDASALVPLCVNQGASPLARAALKNKTLAAWWGTPVEMTGAFSRLSRNGDIGRDSFRMAISRLAALRQRWVEVQPTEALRELAEELLLRHPLRAADSLQLAAALVWSNRQPRKRRFVCFDGRLAEAAANEGFTVETI